MRILLSGCSFSFGDELEWQHVKQSDVLTQFDLGDRSIRSEREKKRYRKCEQRLRIFIVIGKKRRFCMMCIFLFMYIYNI